MEEFSVFTEERPWGNFRQFTKNTPSTVKILLIKKGEQFSLQFHNERTEFWKILLGSPEITLGDRVLRATVGDEFKIEPKTNHQVHSIDTDTEILEISFGDFDESDIVRLKDKYGRT